MEFSYSEAQLANIETTLSTERLSTYLAQTGADRRSRPSEWCSRVCLRKLRNRIAHHEPVLARDLAEDYRIILEVVGWICPDTSAWIAETSRFPSAHDAYRLLFP